MMSDPLIVEVSKAAEGGDPNGLLSILLEGERTDIRNQAAVRYLRSIGKWSAEDGSKCAQALEHLFGYYEGRPELSAESYVSMTGDIVKTLWGYEFPIIVQAPKAEPKAPPSKKPRGYKKNEDITLAKGQSQANVEGESGSRIFKSLAGDVDTSQASDRLKKAIEIQRNG